MTAVDPEEPQTCREMQLDNFMFLAIVRLQKLVDANGGTLTVAGRVAVRQRFAEVMAAIRGPSELAFEAKGPEAHQ
jgi:hypothetical protein